MQNELSVVAESYWSKRGFSILWQLAFGCTTLFPYNCICCQNPRPTACSFFLVLLWRGKLTNIFHKSSYCSMCDDGIPFFEISAINADKPPLSISEIKRRVEQFRKAGVDAFHFAILLACCLDCHSNLCKRGSICIKRTRVLFTIHICVHSV